MTELHLDIDAGDAAVIIRDGEARVYGGNDPSNASYLSVSAGHAAMCAFLLHTASCGDSESLKILHRLSDRMEARAADA